MSVPPVLQVDGVGVSFGGQRVLDDVSFEIRPGEFTGLIGSNGVGKTTLLRVILGTQRADRGTVRIGGSDAGQRARSLGYVPQKVILDPDVPMRARDLVALGLDGNRFGFGRRTKEQRQAVEQSPRRCRCRGASPTAGSGRSRVVSSNGS